MLPPLWLLYSSPVPSGLIDQHVSHQWKSSLLNCRHHCYITYYPLVHFTVCLTTGPQPLPKRFSNRVRPSASSFDFQYHLFSLISSGTWLHILPCLTVTSILASIFPSVTWFWRHFHLQMWRIQFVFLHFILGRIFLYSLTLCNISSIITRSV
jgi:hypothetical protein